MAQEELFQYEEKVGYKQLTPYERELFDLYTSVENNKTTPCFDGTDIMSIVIVFMLGACVGTMIKRVF